MFSFELLAEYQPHNQLLVSGMRRSKSGGMGVATSVPLPQNMLHPQELVGGMQVQDWSAMKTVSAGWRCG